MAKVQAIIMKAIDNVCTVVVSIDQPQEVSAEVDGYKINTMVTEKIPFGHKFAVKEIKQGTPVIKYGETIGLATRDIQPGQYVHVHNLESCRGRGDK